MFLGVHAASIIVHGVLLAIGSGGVVVAHRFKCGNLFFI